MTPLLENELKTRFPNLYDRNISIEVGDGWFNLLVALSNQLENLIKQESPESRPNYTASQVKEKYGELRFYMSSSSNEMENLIADAEDASSRLCDVCGSPGATSHNDRGWKVTRCVNHKPYGNNPETE